MNHWLFEQINAFARSTPWLHAPAKSFADYGIVLFAVLLVTGWWIGRRSGDPAKVAAAVSAGIATLIAVAVNVPIVQAVHEARPYVTEHDILVVANHTSDPSFPSDHATMAGAVAVGLLIVNRRLGLVATAAAVLLAFCRVYIAAHYPADVAAGLVLGGIVAVGYWMVIRTALTRVIESFADTRLGPLVLSNELS